MKIEMSLEDKLIFLQASVKNALSIEDEICKRMKSEIDPDQYVLLGKILINLTFLRCSLKDTEND